MKEVLEKFSGFIKNTMPAKTTYGVRIPDFMNKRVVGEIKNASYQYLSSQIRGFIEIARKEGKMFVLVVSQRTRLSGPLIKEGRKVGGIILQVGGNTSKRILAPVLFLKELMDIYTKYYQEQAGWPTEIY